MKQLANLISLGKRVPGTKGGEIVLEDKTAYITNMKRSSLYIATYNTQIGHGRFYAGQAISKADNVEIRDDKTIFTWKEQDTTKREFLPNLDDFSKEAKKVYESKYKTPETNIPSKLISDLSTHFLVTRLQIKDNKIIATQLRSDGSAGLETENPMPRSLLDSNAKDTPSVSVFTSDLKVLEGIITSDTFKISITDDAVVISSPIEGGDLVAVIGKLVYGDDSTGGGKSLRRSWTPESIEEILIDEETKKEADKKVRSLV